MNQKLRAVFFILSSAFTLQLASSVAAQTVLPCNIVLNGIEYPNGSVLYVNAGDPMNFGGVYGAPSHLSGGPGGNIAPALDALSAEPDPQTSAINVDPATDPIRYLGGGTGTVTYSYTYRWNITGSKEIAGTVWEIRGLSPH